MNAKHICLLGFSSQTEQNLKQYLIDHSPQYSFSWAAANAKELEGVVVNAVFLDTPQIKKYLSKIKCPRVAIYTNSVGKNSAEENEIPAIDFTKDSPEERGWLATLLGESISAKKSATANNAATMNGNFSANVEQLINIIKGRKPEQIIAKYENKMTYLDPQGGHAYIDFARDEVPGIELWQWQKTSSGIPKEAMRRINIEQWLFETIWQSKSTIFQVSDDMLYKLIRWPQPFSQVKRTEALRLAAQIKFKPVTINDLISRTNYSSQLIEQFLFATNQAGQVEAIKPQEVKNEPQPKSVRREDPDREIKRGFIGRLRKRLGL